MNQYLRAQRSLKYHLVWFRINRYGHHLSPISLYRKEPPQTHPGVSFFQDVEASTTTYAH